MASTVYAVSFVLDNVDSVTQLHPVVRSDAQGALPDFATWVAVASNETAVSIGDFNPGAQLSFIASEVNTEDGDQPSRLAQGVITIEDLTDDSKVQFVISEIQRSVIDGGDSY